MRASSPWHELGRSLIAHDAKSLGRDPYDVTEGLLTRSRGGVGMVAASDYALATTAAQVKLSAVPSGSLASTS